eukprot:5414480-Pyramimonas_sp.AAC.1
MQRRPSTSCLRGPEDWRGRHGSLVRSCHCLLDAAGLGEIPPALGWGPTSFLSSSSLRGRGHNDCHDLGVPGGHDRTPGAKRAAAERHPRVVRALGPALHRRRRLGH